MVVYAPKGILINENSENLFLCSEKKHFFNEILEKNADFKQFWPIFVSFWPLIYTLRDYLWLFMPLKAS